MRHELLRNTALVLAVGAAALGSPRPPHGIAGSTVEAVAEGRGSLNVVQLARRIRDGEADLHVVDLRPAEAFDDFHLPTATRADLSALLSGAPPTGTTVLYAGGTTLAAQAWTLLRSRTDARLYYLDGGTAAWLGTLLQPVLPEDATQEELEAWPEVADVSRFFGGQPRRGGPRRDRGRAPWVASDVGGADASVSDLLNSDRRRGCGF